MTIEQIIQQLKTLDIVSQLKFIAELYPDQTVFTSSFGVEDQVITDLIFSNNINIKIASLDTGRLFEETYKVYYNTLLKYKKDIEIYTPQTTELEKLLSQKGPYSFYLSVENRKECCNIRKVEPLKRALNGNKCWVTGIRADQSTGRTDMNMIEIDKGYNLIKMNPLLNWSLDQVIDYLKTSHIPYNSLHDKGFISIGCAPCTRAVKSGDDFRSGRWWWENNSGKECGLHTHGK